jgi:hypothetical protein
MVSPFSNGATGSRRTLLRMVAAATLLAAVACGSTAPKTGSLAVTITTPAGVTPSVTVTGGNGFSRTIANTTTLTGLGAGTYTVTAAPVTSANAIVATVNTAAVSGSPATVRAGATPATASATYGIRPGSGGLWVSNFGSAHTTVQYTAAQLAGTTSAAAATSIATGSEEEQASAFDAKGNLWVTINGGTSVVEYSALQLAAGGTPAPAVTISANAGSLNAPSGLAFDAAGDLWVANYVESSIVEFTPSQLAVSGSPAPAVVIGDAVIGDTANSLLGSIGLAFDGQGDLWVANLGTQSECFKAKGASVVEFTPSQLAASGTPTPVVALPRAKDLNGPFMIAFDATGNLWVTNGANIPYSVVAFSPAQLTTSGTPTPAIELTPNAGSLDGPAGLAFDASGDLWVANMLNNSVVEFTPAQIAVSGAPVPATVITGSSLSAPFGIAFDPHPAGLPIKP